MQDFRNLRAWQEARHLVVSIYRQTARLPHEERYGLQARLRRRALVLVLTNLRDEDAGELLPALALLRRRHLVVLASLRERALGETLAAEVADFRDALAVAACHHYLEARERAHEQLRAAGVLTLDVEPERLPIAAVNRYLEVKRSGLL